MDLNVLAYESNIFGMVWVRYQRCSKYEWIIIHAYAVEF